MLKKETIEKMSFSEFCDRLQHPTSYNMTMGDLSDIVRYASIMNRDVNKICDDILSSKSSEIPNKIEKLEKRIDILTKQLEQYEKRDKILKKYFNPEEIDND